MKALIVTSASSETHMTQASILYLASWLKKTKTDFEILDMSGTIDYFNPPDEFFSPWDSDNWLNPNIFHTDLSLDDHPEVDIIYYSSMFSTDIIIHGRHAAKIKELFPSCRTVLGGAAVWYLDSKQLSILRNIFDDVRLESIIDIDLDYSLMPIKSFVTIHSGRGCVYGKCRFCNTNSLSEYDMYYIKSAYDVMKEFQEIEKYKVKDVMLSSDMFTHSYMNRLIGVIIDYKIDVPYNIMLRAEEWIDEEFSNKLRRSGCTDVFIGAEAFEDGIIEFLNKGTCIHNNINAIKNLHNAGIKVEIGMILFIPGITKEQMGIQLNNIKPLLPYIHSINLEILTITNHSEFALHPDRYGIELFPEAGKSIIPSWCYGFSPDIPWTFLNKSEIKLWIDHYDDLRLLLGNVVPPHYYESIDYLKGEFNI
jgi:hypothetical protein